MSFFNQQSIEMTIVFLALLVACSGDKCHLQCVPSILVGLCILIETTSDHPRPIPGDND
jgi:hypothetical protein